MTSFQTLCVCGFEPALRGMRLPLKSYEKADSYYEEDGNFVIGPNDYKLMKSLWKGGTEHRKYLRQIQVWVEIEFPRYVWAEWDTYKIGTSANSESTMHTILKEPFSQSQFEWPPFYSEDTAIENAFDTYIDIIKAIRDKANFEEDNQKKEHYQQILKAMLPESFLQKRTICLNYEVLATMYRQRKNHRLPQWSRDFVCWANSLPYNEFITGIFND